MVSSISSNRSFFLCPSYLFITIGGGFSNSTACQEVNRINSASSEVQKYMFNLKKYKKVKVNSYVLEKKMNHRVMNALLRITTG